MYAEEPPPPTIWDQMPRATVPDPEPAQIDAATRDRVAVACRAAGLTLSDRQFEMACAAAPYVIAMTDRLYRHRGYAEEPANVFKFD